MGDIIETVETAIEELIGGTAISLRDLEKQKRPFEKNIRIAENGIKAEERRNGRLQKEILVIQADKKTSTAAHQLRMQEMDDRIAEYLESIKENSAEISIYKEDIADNQVQLEKINADIEAFKNQK